MKNIIPNLTALLRDSVAALMLRASNFHEDARRMEEVVTKEQLATTIPFVLIQDNFKQRESFANLTELAAHIGADVSDLIDVVRYRNGIFGAFVMHEASHLDGSFSVA